MKRTGAIYIRVSTDKQEELSPDAQKRLLLEYASRNDIIVPAEYVFQDNGISGRKAEKRPEFQKMIGLAKTKDHPIDCIVVWKFSRFARNQEESILYKSLLKKNDVEVISISENTTGEFGTLIERIIEWMDEYYSIRLSEEVRRGMTENAMRGNYQSKPPIGYSSVGNGAPPIVDPDTVIIPLTMKKLLDEGKNTTQIARYCNERGWKTSRGNLYEARTVNYILTNPFYAGKVRWNYTNRGRKLKPEDEVIIVDGRHEPLWTYEEYLRMKESLAPQRLKTPRNVSTCKHWLSGILFCSSCGHSLSYNALKVNAGFQCWAYAKGICNVSHYMRVDIMEQYIIDGLKSILRSDTLSYEIINSIADDTNLKLQELNKTLTRLEQREQRAKLAYLDGIDTKEEYRKNKEYFSEEREKVKSQILELTQRPSCELSKKELDNKMIKNLTDVIEILENPNADYEQKGNAIRSIVDKITFDRTHTVFDISLCLQL